MLPFDLHVLGMPPAFNLSQDQTLQFNSDVNISTNVFLLLYIFCALFLLRAPTQFVFYLLMNLPRRRAAYSTHLRFYVKHFLHLFRFF